MDDDGDGCHDDEALARRFEADRPHLQAVAYRVLGSRSDAEDAVQECWLRLSRSDTSGVENLTGWLTTVVARVSLTMLRARATRSEAAPGDPVPQAEPGPTDASTPEEEVLLADAIGPALLLVLDRLEPAERVAFVLHDVFAVPFEEIATVVDRSPVAARQLASRARRTVQGADPPADADRGRQHDVVAAFLRASRAGRFDELLGLLDPDVVLRADAATVRLGAAPRVVGAPAVAETFSGRARAARAVLVDGQPGAVWAVDGVPRVVFEFAVRNGAVVAIDMVSDPAVVGALTLAELPGRRPSRLEG